MSQNIQLYCEKDFEKCRNRVSAISLISFALFVGAITVLVEALRGEKGIIDNALSGLTSMQTIQASFQIWVVYSAFLIHLIRIYLSLLLFEKDPTWYKKLYIHMDKSWMKWVEYSLRILVGFSLLRIATYNTYPEFRILSTLMPSFQGFQNTLFGKVVILYFCLLLWDFFTISVVPPWKNIKLNPFKFGNIWQNVKLIYDSIKKDERLKFVVNDVLGLIIAFFFAEMELENIKITPDNLVSSVAIFCAIGLVSSALLLYDIFGVNRLKYLHYLKNEFFRANHNIKCPDKCSVDQKS